MNIKDRKIHFLSLNDNDFFSFECVSPLGKMYRFDLCEATFNTQQNQPLYIVFDDELEWNLLELISTTTCCFEGKREIPDTLFEQGMGYHYNLVRKIEYYNFPHESEKSDFQNKIAQNAIHFSKKFSELKLWGNPCLKRHALTWMYNHNDKVYLEITPIYEWYRSYKENESDIEESEMIDEGFEDFLKDHFKMFRYEITPQKAREFSTMAFEVLQCLMPPDRIEETNIFHQKNLHW
ncbi:MAG: hypothetical protein ACO1RX_16710 [Candidatus Sericytochromatia bacterium]